MWQVRIMIKYLILKDEYSTFCLDLCVIFFYMYAKICVFWCAVELSVKCYTLLAGLAF